MADQGKVDRWLAEFVRRLREAFGERLMFVGHHGSWARGEARPDSDIDAMVVVDRIEPADLQRYRDVIAAMPGGGRRASGFLVSTEELRAWPRLGLLQFFYGCKVLHGSADGVVARPTDADLIEDIRIKASTNLFDARHYLLYPHDHSQVVHRLTYHFKNCFYALQSWMLLQEGRFCARKDEMIGALSDDDDREVVRASRDWADLEKDREARPLYYIGLLERWSRKTLSRVPSYEHSRQRDAE